jgi:AcrR family transcriptional regulator
MGTRHPTMIGSAHKGRLGDPPGSATKPRERILATSLALFNDEGVATVSGTRIAAELGMSQGNLHYHFRRKNEIVERLVRRWEQDSEPVLAGPSAGPHSVDDFWLFLHLAFEKIFEYRFIYRDIDYLLGEFPDLGPRLRRLTARGVETTTRLCTQLAAAGCLRANREDIEVLALQMILTATCWFTFAKLLPDGADVGPGRAAYQVLSLLAPFLADDERLYVEYLRRKYRA